MSHEHKLISIYLCGVGGQGIVKLGDLIAELAFMKGYQVKKNEIHGLSQRGGSVSSHVKYGTEVLTPVIGEGKADFVVAMEKLEALRNAHMVKPSGLILVNDQVIMPASCMAGGEEYPDDIIEQLKEFGKVEEVKAFDIAMKFGDARIVNVGLAGALAKHLEFKEEEWLKVIEKVFPKKAFELNSKVFKAMISQ